MAKKRIKKICNADAIAIASRLMDYRRPNGPVIALRRKCKNLSMEEAKLAIAIGTSVVEEAIILLNPKNEIELEEFRTRKPNGPTKKVRTQCEMKLIKKFPACTIEGARNAIVYAIFYNII